MKPYPYNLLDDLAGDDDGFHSELDDCEVHQELEKLIFGLSDRYTINKHIAKRMQTVLHLRYVEGRTLASIGQVMGLSGSRVGQIKSRALRILRNPAKFDRLVHKSVDEG